MKRICPFTGREVVVIDCEFFYSQEYTLSTMPIAVYMQDNRFELMITSVEHEVGQPVYHVGDVMTARDWIKQFALEDKVVACHYGFIEGSILEWKLNVKPFRYFCTLMASRPFFVPWTGSSALEQLSAYLEIGTKGDAVKKMKGKHLADLDGGQQLEYLTYNQQDTMLTGRLYDIEIKKFTEWNPSGDEVELIDFTIKKFTRPRLMLHPQVIEQAHAELVQYKSQLLAAAGVSRATLMSDSMLAVAFLATNEAGRGALPTKFSQKKQRDIYAFAKTDRAFHALAQRGPRSRALVEARLAHKSTIEETRLARFSAVARATRNVLPVPLLYYGAHTGRWSGGDKINLQNLGRASKLRAAIVAPKGYRIVTGDLSQIEARITACLAGETDLVEDFRNGIDVYSKFATKIYGYEVNKIDHEKKERFVGKTSILSLGFMAGAPKFHKTMNDVFKFPMELSEAEHIVRTYRDTYFRIPKLWRTLDTTLAAMCHLDCNRELGPLRFMYQHIVLPNGMPIFYPELSRDSTSNGWTYTSGGKKELLFSGKVLENTVSGIARIIMSLAELKIARQLGQRAALTVHDELVYVIKNADVDQFKIAFEKTLSANVPWMPSLPVACSIKDGQSYLEAK